MPGPEGAGMTDAVFALVFVWIVFHVTPLLAFLDALLTWRP